MQAQVDVGVLLVKVRQAHQQPLLQEGGEDAHHQGTGAPIDARFVDRALERFEAGAHLRQQPFAFAGELHDATTTPEKRRPQIFFEGANLHADRADGHAESAGGA